MSDAIALEENAATTPSDLNMPDIPASLRALMAEVGPKWRDDTAGHVDMMITAFSEVLKLVSRDDVTVHRDIAYGPHERQHLDVFLPVGNVTAPPVVLFVHGGAFVSGHRNRTEQVYSNVLCYLAQRGIAGINVGYRLQHMRPIPAQHWTSRPPSIGRAPMPMNTVGIPTRYS